MAKKEYQKPTINVVMTQHSQMLCQSTLRSIQSKGLDEDETLEYGDQEGNKSYNAWDNAW